MVRLLLISPNVPGPHATGHLSPEVTFEERALSRKGKEIVEVVMGLDVGSEMHYVLGTSHGALDQ